MATFSKISLEQMENMLSKGNSKTEKYSHIDTENCQQKVNE